MATQGPTPADILYQLRHATDDRRPRVLIVTGTLMVLCIIAVAFRFWSRRLSGQKILVDDWCMGAALFFQIADSIIVMAATKYGYGRHVVLIGQDGIVKFLKVEYAYEILYVFVISFTKASLLLLYRRIFHIPKFRIAVNVMATYLTLWFLASVNVAVFQCSPPSHFYNRFAPGSCSGPLSFQEVLGAFNILSDVLLLILPLPVVWKLHVNRSQKIALSGVFLVGGFVCVASITRAPYLRATQDTIDPTYTNVISGLWSVIETSVGVICANLAVMRPLMKKYILNPISFIRNSSANTRGNSSENSDKKPHLFASARKVKPQESQSSTLFSSQASTQIQSQSQSEVFPETDEIELPTNRGWRSFLPHKESRFVGDTTIGSVIDTNHPDSTEGDPAIPMGKIHVKNDVEWRGSIHSAPQTQPMPVIPEPDAAKLPNKR